MRYTPNREQKKISGPHENNSFNSSAHLAITLFDVTHHNIYHNYHSWKHAKNTPHQTQHYEGIE